MEITILLIALISLLLAGSAVFVSRKNQKRIEEIVPKDQKNIEEYLKKIKEESAKQKGLIEEIDSRLKEIETKLPKNVRTIKFHRYDAYKDTGGQMSFVLVLLDGQNNGVIINSMHGRDTTRIYGKVIKNGKSEAELSAEEKQTLEEALVDK